MIAVRGGDRVIAVGDQAYEMYGKNPPDVDVRTPLQDGVIADAERAGFILRKLLARADAHMGLSPSLYMSVPFDMSRIERRAYYEVGMRAGFSRKRIHLLLQPYMDALGAGIDMQKAKGTMIVNIGAQHVTICVLSGGQIGFGRILCTGGNAIDERISDLIRRRKNVVTGPRSSSRLKHALCDMGEGSEARKLIGMDFLSGHPREVVISKELVVEAARTELDPIAQEIKTLLERIPPQIASCIHEEGILMTGGCSRIRHLEDYIQEITECKVVIPSSYEETTVFGLKTYIKEGKNLSVLEAG